MCHKGDCIMKLKLLLLGRHRKGRKRREGPQVTPMHTYTMYLQNLKWETFGYKLLMTWRILLFFDLLLQEHQGQLHHCCFFTGSFERRKVGRFLHFLIIYLMCVGHRGEEEDLENPLAKSHDKIALSRWSVRLETWWSPLQFSVSIYTCSIHTAGTWTVHRGALEVRFAHIWCVLLQLLGWWEPSFARCRCKIPPLACH